MEFILRENADWDLTNAYSWYELKQPGLGKRFLNELFKYFEKIERSIIEYRRYFLVVRYLLLNKFPFSVLFIKERSVEVLVVAILHNKQDIRRIMQERI